MSKGGYRPATSGGPDLVLLDNADRVRAVIEHKRGGPSQVTAAVTMLAGAYFDDSIARSVVPVGDFAWHPPVNDGSCGCDFHTHPRKADRYVRAGVWQIDGYRSTRWWLRNAKRDGVTLDDPRQVLWVLLDRDGRSADEAFPGSATAEAREWHTTDYESFTQILRAEHDAARLRRGQQADTLGMLETVLRMAAS